MPPIGRTLMNTTIKTRRTLFLTVIGIAFAASLAGAAWLGVESALLTLPPSAKSPGEAFRIGTSVKIEGNGEPILLAREVQPLRDFFFAHRSAEARREGDAEARGIRRIFEPIEARILARDADTLKIAVATGSLAGAEYWVHVSQMPSSPAASPP